MPEVGSFPFLGPDDEEITFHYSNPAQINQAWGSIASQVAGAGAMGEHSSAHGAFMATAGGPCGRLATAGAGR